MQTHKPTFTRLAVLLLGTPLAVFMLGCGGSPASKLSDRGTPKSEYKAAVKTASSAGIMVSCDGEGEVTFLDFHAHPNVSSAVEHVRAFPNLKMLNFSSSKLTDDDLANVAGAVHVEELGLHGTDVSDAGLDHILKLTKLRQLNLTDTTVGDMGLAKLAGLSSLVRLNLVNTQVTDAGLKHLDSLKDLMYIELSNCAVTEDALNQLRSKFPDAQVISEIIVDTSDVPMHTDAELPDV